MLLSPPVSVLESVSVSWRPPAPLNGLSHTVDSVTSQHPVLVGAHSLHAVVHDLLCGDFLPIDYPRGG